MPRTLDWTMNVLGFTVFLLFLSLIGGIRFVSKGPVEQSSSCLTPKRIRCEATMEGSVGGITTWQDKEGLYFETRDVGAEFEEDYVLVLEPIQPGQNLRGVEKATWLQKRELICSMEVNGWDDRYTIDFIPTRNGYFNLKPSTMIPLYHNEGEIGMPQSTYFVGVEYGEVENITREEAEDLGMEVERYRCPQGRIEL